MNETFLHQLLDLLTSNKKLPYYQAERRIDIFINFFLEDIMNHCLKSESIRFVVPEFPLKKDGNARSTKVDYLCFDSKKNTFYFVELKTDNASFKPGQLSIYINNRDWKKCLEGLRVIEDKTRYHSKFTELRNKLNECNTSVPPIQAPEIKVVYIVPSISKDQRRTHKDISFITFSDLQRVRPARFQDEWKIILDRLLK